MTAPPAMTQSRRRRRSPRGPRGDRGCQTVDVAFVELPATYLEWPARQALDRYVSCTWQGGVAGDGLEPVLPDGCMDVIWNGVRLFVAGPDTGPVADEHGGAFAVGLRFWPGMAPLFLDCPADEVRDARVDLDFFWPDAPALADRLSGAESLRGAARMLEDAAAFRVATARAPDAVVEHAARTWAADPSAVRVTSLARECGLGERQLQRRFVASVGYGPKFLHRVLRFQCFLRQSGGPSLGLSELAYRCGYADQAHLNRETAALAGRTPAELQTARREA